MAYTFLNPQNIGELFEDSTSYMRPFFEPLAELERLSRGKPGRVPKGKPRVTDGTLAGVTRETPKRIIQQLPTGKVIIKKKPDAQELCNAVLTDEILPNANSGGTPYAKSKNSIKDVIRTGASAAYCFYNRRGDYFGADFRRVYVKDIAFEKGKVSEFDCNYMFMTGWYTKSDIESIIHEQDQRNTSKKKKDLSSEDWDKDVLRELLDSGDTDKSEQNKSESEKRNAEVNQGYFELVHCFQVGEGAKFYTYAPRIKKVARTWKNRDPRGVIPIHILVPEEDYANPLGEALLSISAGKQNLLDFDMQMYQYSQGLQYSPPVKTWGNVPSPSTKLVPDAILPMGGPKGGGNDIETIDIGNRAQQNFANNYGLIKSQILNEMGVTSDTSISSTAGNPGFSKTDAGVNALQARLSISDNDLRKSYELWFGRICETLLNIHFAENKGSKDVELQDDTMKRLKLTENPTINYEEDLGKLKFTVDASTSEAANSKDENDNLTTIMEIRAKYGQNPDAKTMLMINQIIKNSVADNADELMYTDDEIEQAKAMEQQAMQAVMQQAQQAQITSNQPQNTLPQAQPAMPPQQEMGQSQNVMQPEPQMTESQQGLNDDEMQTIEALQQRGVPQEDIATVLTMLRNGMDDSEIAKVLGGQS